MQTAYRNGSMPWRKKTLCPNATTGFVQPTSRPQCFGVACNGGGYAIEWKYIVQLHELQEKEGLRVANKLTRAHVEYCRQLTSKLRPRVTMQSWRVILVLGALMVLAVMSNVACAAYRKPPFNGSIFGKRSRGDLNNADIKYAMCEAVWDTCTQWFPLSQDGTQ